MLVRGRGSQKDGNAPQPDDDEDLHVLVAGDSEVMVSKAVEMIEAIIFADENTRTRIRQEQLKIVAKIKHVDSDDEDRQESRERYDLSRTTPYGKPAEDAFVIPVPKDCVGLVIGRGGETIRNL